MNITQKNYGLYSSFWVIFHFFLGYGLYSVWVVFHLGCIPYTRYIIYPISYESYVLYKILKKYLKMKRTVWLDLFAIFLLWVHWPRDSHRKFPITSSVCRNIYNALFDLIFLVWRIIEKMTKKMTTRVKYKNGFMKKITKGFGFY